jgi:branched-chain amino acid transport system permease protein
MGSYTLAILLTENEWSPGWTYPMAALLCFGMGVVVGVPALRLTGLYLALVTLALAQIFPALLRKFDDVTGGSKGIGGLRYDPPGWTGLDSGRQGRAEWLYWVALGTLVLGYVLVRNLVKSRIGRAMVAVRDNTIAASVMGVHVAFVKTVTFGLSASLAGIAGCTFALRQTQTTPENINFTILGSIIFLVIMVIGGAGSLAGPIVGAFIYYRVDQFTREVPDKSWLPEASRDFLQGRPNLATLVFATLLILLMFVAPFGVVGFVKRVAARVLVVVPRRPTDQPSTPIEPGEVGAGDAAAFATDRSPTT